MRYILFLFLTSCAIADTPFFGGQTIYSPVVDTITTGVSLDIRPTVSGDKKYVTLSGSYNNSNLIKLQNFSVVKLPVINIPPSTGMTKIN